MSVSGPSDLPNMRSPSDQQMFREALREHWLLAELEPALRDRVFPLFELKQIPSRTWLFRQGAASDGIVVMLSGRCRAYREAGESRVVLGEIGPGELIGEAAVLSKGQRMASVATLRDTVVAWLPQPELDALLEAEPVLWRVFGRIAVERALAPAPPSVGQTLVIRPEGPCPDLRWFVDCAAAALGRFGRVIVLDETIAADRTDAEVSRQLSEAALSTDILLLVGNSELDSWTQRCVRNADRVVLVVDIEHSAVGTRIGLNTMIGGQLPVEASLHLVLLQPAGLTRAGGTAPLIGQFRPDSHHHVRRGSQEDAARAARLAAGRGFGVVFGGASSRGTAHAGVVAALAELGLTVDAVAGCSSGAGTAIGLAMGRDSDAIVESYLSVSTGLMPRWFRYGPPFVALMSGHAARNAFREVFGDTRLEDLLLPCSVAAVDVNSADVVHLRTGEAWIAARATSSLPGFWPPVVTGDKVLVDGGVASNVPTEALELGCSDGVILTIDLLPRMDGDDMPFPDIEPYGDAISGWRLLFRRLLSKKPRVPALVDLLTHVAMIPNTHRQRRLSSRPHRAVRALYPPVPSYGFFEVGPAEARKLVALVHAHTLGALPGLLEDTPFAISNSVSTPETP